MKTLLTTIAIATALLFNAQTSTPIQYDGTLPELTISKDISLHIISPEPIQYVDLSTNNLIGDLPTENIARIKIASAPNDSINGKPINYNDLGIITVVGQSFIAQYKANFSDPNTHNIITNIQIQPENMQPLEFTKIGFSKQELYNFSLNIIKKKRTKPLRKVTNFKLSLLLNNVYVIGDYIFLDISFENTSNLSYNIDGLNFSINDKKIYKATNNQSINLKPEFQLYSQKSFKKDFHNIYVFKKFTYPNSKVLLIRMIEEPISGRTLEMKVKWSDIIKADTF